MTLQPEFLARGSLQSDTPNLTESEVDTQSMIGKTLQLNLAVFVLRS